MKNKTCNFFGEKELNNLALIQVFLRMINIPVDLLLAVLLSQVITHSTTGAVNKVLVMGTLILAIIILKKIFDILFGIFFAKRKSRVLHKCKIKMYKMFLKNKLSFLYSLKNGEILENFNDDFEIVINKYVNHYPVFLTGIITATVYLAFLIFKSWPIAVILLVISFLQIVPPFIVKRYLQVNYNNCREVEAKITDFIVEGYRGFVLIKLYELKSWWLGQLKEYHKKYLKVGKNSIFTGTAENTLNEFVSQILTYGTYALIGLMVLNGWTTLDTGIQAIALSGGLFKSIKSVFSIIGSLAVAEMAEKRFASWYESIPEHEHVLKNSTIRISDMSYSYENNELFRNFNISIDSSKITLIKGENGTGKTTLLNLITGIISCPKGTINIGDVEVCFLTDHNFRHDVFFLPQHDANFDLTAMELYELYFSQDKNDVLHIAYDFYLTDDLLKTKKISELSGGERKKVFLSLAFASNSNVLILDEPTNSLDENGRAVLYHLLQRQRKGAIIVTHESYLDDIAEVIYALKKGGTGFEKK